MKASLRAELMSRSLEDKPRRSMALAVVVVMVFGFTMLDEEPLESFNFGLNLVGSLGHALVFEGQSSHVGSFAYGESDSDNLPVALSAVKALRIKEELEIFQALHLAGLTRLESITGITIGDRTNLNALYQTVSDSTEIHGPVSIRHDIRTTDADWPEILEFYQSRYSRLFGSTVFDTSTPASRDTILILQGEELLVSLYACRDSVLGDLLLWSYRSDSPYD